MCGIAGVIRVHEPGDAPPPPPLESIPESWLDVLDDSIKHRGPDGEGRFRDRAVREDGAIVDIALVHRRLSIIDPEDGAQPMIHDGERLRPDLVYHRGEAPIVASEVEPERPLVGVVFNGCIYNHRELREELEGKGYVFGTDHSDTEVLVHGWRAWGLRLLDELDGMYGAIAWDRRTGQLGWGRDLVGEKPLYQSGSPTNVRILSSCLPSLAAIGEPTPYLVGFQWWIRDGATFIPPIPAYGVNPREWSICPREPRQGAEKRNPRFATEPLTSVRRGYKLPERPGPETIGETRAKKLCEQIEPAITSRLEADVPLGVFLSGGIDSALIAAITHTHRPDVRAYTVRMDDARFDESSAASETAKHIGIEHQILECDPDPAHDLVKLIEQMGLPFGDSSLLPTYWVSKAAREHVKVALSGDGGDELFGGYRRHTIAPTLHRWRRVLRLIPTRVLDQRVPGSRSTYLARLVPAARFGGYSELLSIFPTPDLRRLIPSIEGEIPGDSTFRHIEDPLREDFEHYLPDDLLRKSDTASMAVGLEVRAPFLAKELVEAALRTPLDILMPNGERKGLLKQVARKYLPDHIVDRPKQGFAIPIGEWFRSDYGSMRQLMLDHLRSSDPFPGLGEAGVEINMTFVERMIREHDAAGEKSINPWHGRDHSQRLYMLVVLSIWCKWLARVRTGTEQRA